MFSEESINEEGRTKGKSDLHNLGKWENARIRPRVIDHFALVLVSLIFEGPSVFVVAGKITTIMPGTFPIFLLSTKKIIVATTTTKASIKIIWKLP